MRPNLVVIDEPRIGADAQLGERSEILYVEELIADARVERFDPCILRGFSGIEEMQHNIVVNRPLQHRAGDVLRPIINAKALGISADLCDLVERSNNASAGK